MFLLDELELILFVLGIKFHLHSFINERLVCPKNDASFGFRN